MPPNTMTKKRCIACHEVKSLASFHKDQRAADGHRSICKACRLEGRTASAQEPQPVVSIAEDVGMYLRGTHVHQLIDLPEDEWLLDRALLRKEWDKQDRHPRDLESGPSRLGGRAHLRPSRGALPGGCMPMALPSRPDLTTYGRPKRRSKPCLSSERPGAMRHPHRRGRNPLPDRPRRTDLSGSFPCIIQGCSLTHTLATFASSHPGHPLPTLGQVITADLRGNANEAADHWEDRKWSDRTRGWFR